MSGVRAQKCVDCKEVTFKNIGAKDKQGQPVHDFNEALRLDLIPCSRPLQRCVNPLPELDRYSLMVLRFYLRKGVQSQWPVGFGIPNGLPRPNVIIEAEACGIEWTEHFADKFATCEAAHVAALRELNPSTSQ